ncbi:hypothetical protein WMY93_008018 [Mugilogobius chulae]|uniref:Uncharacterized protein n=1 Tax=Mugilogobius chulae TaxID=88201 RepID=A0AAW0PNJ6_9GOBI
MSSDQEDRQETFKYQGEETPSTWPYYLDMHEEIGCRPAITPPVLVASCMSSQITSDNVQQTTMAPRLAPHAVLDPVRHPRSPHPVRDPAPHPRDRVLPLHPCRKNVKLMMQSPF